MISAFDWALHLMTIVWQMFWINPFLTISLCKLIVCESSKDQIPASLGHHSEWIWGQQLESDRGVWAPLACGVSYWNSVWGYIQTGFLMFFVKPSEEQFCSTVESCSQFFSNMSFCQCLTDLVCFIQICFSTSTFQISCSKQEIAYSEEKKTRKWKMCIFK